MHLNFYACWYILDKQDIYVLFYEKYDLEVIGFCS